MADSGGLTGKALIAEPEGVFRLADVVTAPVGKDDIGIRALWSGVSIGTEFAVLTGKLDWGSFPLVTGYMATGVVLSVGSEVSDFSAGDMVYYRRNAALQLRGTGTSLNCRSGHARVGGGVEPSGQPRSRYCPGRRRPRDGEPLRHAVGRPLRGRPGWGRRRGNGRRDRPGHDRPRGRQRRRAAWRRGHRYRPRGECRSLATKFGAVTTFATDDEGTSDRVTDVLEATSGRGADFVFESTGRPECIDAGIAMCRQFGCFVWQGNYGDGPVSFEFLEAHHRRLRMVFPCDDGYRAYRRASLQAVASGAMPWGEVITQRISYEEMPAFYADIFHHKGPSVIGAVVNWEAAEVGEGAVDGAG